MTGVYLKGSSLSQISDHFLNMAVLSDSVIFSPSSFKVILGANSGTIPWKMRVIIIMIYDDRREEIVTSVNKVACKDNEIKAN